MRSSDGIVVPVTEPTRVGEARRAASSLASAIGFDEDRRGKVSIVATELAKNLALHAKQGELLLQRLGTEPQEGLEILALDAGPGMADVDRCFRDGYSTAGTPGNGLGAVARLSDRIDVHSLPGVGTVILARFDGAPAGPVEIGGVSVARPGESCCGDAWAVRHEGDRTLVVVADGLGHGPVAAEAAREAVAVLGQGPARGAADTLQIVHGALRSTRGAAVAVAEIDRAARLVRFAGVGNISAAIDAEGSTRSLVSHNGIVGHEMRRVQEFTAPWPEGALLILHSDGVARHWKLEQYAGIRRNLPSVVAGVLYRDFKRGNDDATLLVLGDGAGAKS